MKWCPKCEEHKYFHEFRKNDGYCKECRREYTNDWRTHRRGWEKKADIETVEITVACANCNELFSVTTEGSWNKGKYECPWCGHSHLGTTEAKFVA
jgi:DNA-directed RNA polymerase subunit RPC12/RpoP